MKLIGFILIQILIAETIVRCDENMGPNEVHRFVDWRDQKAERQDELIDKEGYLKPHQQNTTASPVEITTNETLQNNGSVQFEKHLHNIEETDSFTEATTAAVAEIASSPKLEITTNEALQNNGTVQFGKDLHNIEETDSFTEATTAAVAEIASSPKLEITTNEILQNNGTVQFGKDLHNIEETDSFTEATTTAVAEIASSPKSEKINMKSADTECRDRVPHCSGHLGLCHDTGEYIFGHYYCQKTCGYCDEQVKIPTVQYAQTCFDNANFCANLTDWCFTKGYKQIQEFYCRKTCSKCSAKMLDPFAPTVSDLSTIHLKIKTALGDNNPVKSTGMCRSFSESFSEENRHTFFAGIYNLSKQLLDISMENSLGNMVISPISVGSLLNLVYLTAQGKAKKSIETSRLLNMSPSDSLKAYSSVQNYFRDFSSGALSTPNTNLHTSSILFLSDENRIRYEFRDRIVGCLNSFVYVTNLKVNHTYRLHQLNRAILGSLKQQKIVYNLPKSILNNETNMFLFGGASLSVKFGVKPGTGFEKQFFAHKRKPFLMPMTYLVGNFGIYHEPVLDLHVVAMDTVDKLQTMFMFMPTAVGKLREIMKKVDSSYMLQLMNNMDYSLKFGVMLPDFKITQWVNLESYLTGMGLDAIVEDSNLSKMFLGYKIPMKYDGLYQLASFEVTVNRNTSEARNSTNDLKSLYDNQPVFFVDRPFVYILRDNPTNTILFTGQFVDPADQLH